MDKLTVLIERGMEIKKKVSKNRNKVVSNALKEEICIWKNQCVLYVDSLKISKIIKTRFDIAAINLDYNSQYKFQYIDEMLNVLKALLPQEDAQENQEISTPQSNMVFIVHGHKKALRDEVKNVLYEIGLNLIVEYV